MWYAYASDELTYDERNAPMTYIRLYGTILDLTPRLYEALIFAVVDNDVRFNNPAVEDLAKSLENPVKQLKRAVTIKVSDEGLIALYDELDYRRDIWQDWGAEGRGLIKTANRVMGEIAGVLDELTA